MKREVVEPFDSGQSEVLVKLKSALRQKVLDDIEQVGIRDSMTTEYFELAGAMSKVLKMLDSYGFFETLNDADKNEYEKMMLEISQAALRCQILVEESAAADHQFLLAVTPPESKLMN